MRGREVIAQRQIARAARKGSKTGTVAELAGLKAKDLCGIPWRVAFALQEDGWYLRSDIVWAKKNCMPESVLDRPTRSHEYIFLLTKSERYFYDAAAIQEPFADERMGNPRGGGQYARDAFAYAGPHAQSGLQKGEWNEDGGKTGRNKRDVWHIGTQPYPEAHYATFPEEIPEICIKAGSRPGRCDFGSVLWIRNCWACRGAVKPTLDWLRSRLSGFAGEAAEEHTEGFDMRLGYAVELPCIFLPSRPSLDQEGAMPTLDPNWADWLWLFLGL